MLNTGSRLGKRVFGRVREDDYNLAVVYLSGPEIYFNKFW